MIFIRGLIILFIILFSIVISDCLDFFSFFLQVCLQELFVEFIIFTYVIVELLFANLDFLYVAGFIAFFIVKTFDFGYD